MNNSEVNKDNSQETIDSLKIYFNYWRKPKDIKNKLRRILRKMVLNNIPKQKKIVKITNKTVLKLNVKNKIADEPNNITNNNKEEEVESIEKEKTKLRTNKNKEDIKEINKEDNKNKETNKKETDNCYWLIILIIIILILIYIKYHKET